jgi:uncharacterized membrane protein
MSTLTVLKFYTADGADRIAEALRDLQKAELITLRDAALVSWPDGRSKPKTRQLFPIGGLSALDGAFWGLLFGILFFIPLAGMVLGVAFGGISGSMVDIGIDDPFVRDVRKQITKGTSALFLLTSRPIVDRITNEVRRRKIEFEVVTTELPAAQEELLRETFAS